MWRVEVLRGGGAGRDRGMTPTVSPHTTRRAAKDGRSETFVMCERRGDRRAVSQPDSRVTGRSH